jgi:hypothetical protein
MGIQSNAHFGVDADNLDVVVAEVRAALRGFETEQYGVLEHYVERRNDTSFVIKFEMANTDADQADVDAEHAIEALKLTLRHCFESYSVKDRQRELTLS